MDSCQTPELVLIPFLFFFSSVKLSAAKKSQHFSFCSCHRDTVSCQPLFFPPFVSTVLSTLRLLPSKCIHDEIFYENIKLFMELCFRAHAQHYLLSGSYFKNPTHLDTWINHNTLNNSTPFFHVGNPCSYWQLDESRWSRMALCCTFPCWKKRKKECVMGKVIWLQ